MSDQPQTQSAIGKIGAELLNLGKAALAWERANPRKVAVAMLYLSTHSSRLKPLIGFVAALMGLQLGCLGTPLTANQQKLACFEQAIAPVVGDVYDTTELVRDFVNGKASLQATLHNLQVDEATTKALADRVNACVKPSIALPAPYDTVMQ